jgi:release factor glutamine methyltransferase
MAEEKQWTVGGVLQWTKQFFADKGIDNPRLDAEVLLAHVLRTDRIRLYVEYHKPLQPEELAAYRELVKQRAQRIPVAYLTEEKEFMGLSFYVGPAVLIPRPDTEILVEAVLDRAKGLEKARIVDVGTGSGAIGVSVLYNLPTAWGRAIDISADALTIARKNAERFGVAARMEFLHGDLLEPVAGECFDIVVSNPPYIPTKDVTVLATEVQREPLQALDGGKDGLNFYRKIIEQSTGVLKGGGWLLFEVGINQAQDVAALIRVTSLFESIEIIKDLAGIDRVVAGRRKAC